MLSSVFLTSSLLAAAVNGIPFCSNALPTSVAVVDNAYIVELEHDANLAVRSSELDTRAHETFHKRAAHLDYSIRREFAKPALFYGLSIQLNNNVTSAEARSQVTAIEGVKNIWPIRTVELSSPRPHPEEPKKPRRRCIPRPTKTSTGAPSATASSTDTLTPPKATGDIDVQAALRMADIDKLHAMGNQGQRNEGWHY